MISCSYIWSPRSTKVFLSLAGRISFHTFYSVFILGTSRKLNRTSKICVLHKCFHCLFYFGLISPSPTYKYITIKAAFFRPASKLWSPPPLQVFQRLLPNRELDLWESVSVRVRAHVHEYNSEFVQLFQ